MIKDTSKIETVKRKFRENFGFHVVHCLWWNFWRPNFLDTFTCWKSNLTKYKIIWFIRKKIIIPLWIQHTIRISNLLSSDRTGININNTDSKTKTTFYLFIYYLHVIIIKSIKKILRNQNNTYLENKKDIKL